nr:MAG: capsid protein [Cressdnaviricota sp.]
MSGLRGAVRKVYDVPPASATSTASFNGGGSPSTEWVSGILDGTTYAGAWLTQLAESTADNGRVGISVALETFDWRVKVVPQDTVIGHKHLRMLVVADNECDGNAPALTEILGDANGSATTVATGLEMSFNQPGYFGRFKIIEDKNWMWYNAGSTNGVQDAVSTHCFYHESHHDMKDHTLLWDTTDSSAIADARKGHIFFAFMYSNVTTAAGGLPTLTTADPPTIQYTARFRYRDA